MSIQALKAHLVERLTVILDVRQSSDFTISCMLGARKEKLTTALSIICRSPYIAGQLHQVTASPIIKPPPSSQPRSHSIVALESGMEQEGSASILYLIELSQAQGSSPRIIVAHVGGLIGTINIQKDIAVNQLQDSCGTPKGKVLEEVALYLLGVPYSWWK